MNSTLEIQTPRTSRRAAFTFIELLVVIAVLALLATIAYPALAKTKNNGHAAQCQSNLRRLTAAWIMYVNDNSDRMITGASPVAGAMSTFSDATNTALLVDPTVSLLAPYVKDPTLYKCPADNSQSAGNPRVRSVSMNFALGGSAANILNQIPDRTYFSAKKMFELTTPGPAAIYVFLDEHPASINDSTFQVALGRIPSGAQWVDLPGSFHNGSGSFSFADGHVDLKRWRDTRTLNAVTPIFVPSSDDYVWFNDHSPYKN